jgi:hypothetical protein
MKDRDSHEKRGLSLVASGFQNDADPRTSLPLTTNVIIFRSSSKEQPSYAE